MSQAERDSQIFHLSTIVFFLKCCFDIAIYMMLPVSEKLKICEFLYASCTLPCQIVNICIFLPFRPNSFSNILLTLPDTVKPCMLNIFTYLSHEVSPVPIILSLSTAVRNQWIAANVQGKVWLRNCSYILYYCSKEQEENHYLIMNDWRETLPMETVFTAWGWHS